MKIIFPGQTRGYVSEDDEEIISVSPTDDGSVSFLTLRRDGTMQTWKLIFDPRSKQWRDECAPFVVAA